MSNISRNTAQGEVAVLLDPTTTYFVLSYIITTMSIILNCIEIKLIVRNIKKATDFEIVLLNLAIADLLNSVIHLAVTVITQYSTYGNELRFDRSIYWIGGILTFSVLSSVSFVAVIGVERFFAIKVPLQHRMWHSNRRRLVRYIALTWLLDVILVMAPLVIEYLLESKNSSVTSTVTICYLIAGLLTIGSVVVVVLYVWVLHLMLSRTLKLFDFDKKVHRINQKTMKEAMKKEKSSILICVLVVLSFLACNLTLAIDLFQLQFTTMTDILMKLSAFFNPLIYFFKSYLERHYAKKKLVPSTHERDNSKWNENGGHVSNGITENAGGLDGIGRDVQTITTQDITIGAFDNYASMKEESGRD